MEAFIEDSSDLEDTREDYKNELIMLHATLKKLDRDLDFSAILNPLLAETGPAIAYAQKLGRQKIRMEKIRDDLVAKMLPERSACSTAAHEAVRPFPFGCNQVAEGQSAAPAGGTITGLPGRSFMARPAAPSDRSSSSTPAHDFHVAPALPSRGRHGPRAAQTGADIVPSEEVACRDAVGDQK